MKSMDIELDGTIWLKVEEDDGTITKEELDGEIVLKLIVSAIEEGIDLMEKDLEKEKLNEAPSTVSQS